jgi:hypothetical protein
MPTRFCSAFELLRAQKQRGRVLDLELAIRGASVPNRVLHLAVGRGGQAFVTTIDDHVVQPEGLGIGAQPHQLRPSRLQIEPGVRTSGRLLRSAPVGIVDFATIEEAESVGSAPRH